MAVTHAEVHSLAFLIALLVVGSIYTSTVCAQQDCQSSGVLPSDTSDHTCPPGQDPSTALNCCNPSSATCCEPGGQYPKYSCSPPVTSTTPAIMTLNSFSEGGDGGGAPSCSGQFYPATESVVALSSGWYNYNYNGAPLCLQNIAITANGITVMAMVVDKCDSEVGCDADHNYQVPCRNNVVDASQAVWDALGISSDAGETDITWAPAA